MTQITSTIRKKVIIQRLSSNQDFVLKVKDYISIIGCELVGYLKLQSIDVTWNYTRLYDQQNMSSRIDFFLDADYFAQSRIVVMYIIYVN